MEGLGATMADATDWVIAAVFALSCAIGFSVGRRTFERLGWRLYQWVHRRTGGDDG